MNSPLDQLRGIHYPEPVSWWPLAPGWWLMIILAFAILVFIFKVIKHHYPVYKAKRAALLELRNIEQLACDDRKKLFLFMALIKRYANALGEKKINAMHGNDLSMYLQDNMPKETATLLCEERFSNVPITINKGITKDIQHWIKRYKP